MPDPEGAAQRLATLQAQREVVPSDPELSGRWHRHGVPSPVARWNYHPEYEVHLITTGTGWFVVGDCIDIFTAGQLVLVGSNVPHHWISDLEPGERLPQRDVVFQFHPDWIERCSQLLPELGRLAAVLQQSRRGIEFSGSAREAATVQLHAIGSTSGAERLSHIFGLFGIFADSTEDERHLLAGEWVAAQGQHVDRAAQHRIDLAFDFIFTHLGDPDLRLAAAADHVGMSEWAFSRYLLGSAASVSATRSAVSGSARPASCCAGPPFRSQPSPTGSAMPICPTSTASSGLTTATRRVSTAAEAASGRDGPMENGALGSQQTTGRRHRLV